MTQILKFPFSFSPTISSGKVYSNPNRLNIHIRQVHKKVDAYRCNICFQRYSYKAAATKCEAVHSGVKNIKCEYCEKMFYTVSQKVTHRSTAHPKYRQCEHCDFVTKSLQQLHRHVEEEHFFWCWMLWYNMLSLSEHASLNKGKLFEGTLRKSMFSTKHQVSKSIRQLWEW
jgi:hypothetical protein